MKPKEPSEHPYLMLVEWSPEDQSTIRNWHVSFPDQTTHACLFHFSPITLVAARPPALRSFVVSTLPSLAVAQG
jgi:hypothetical protein